MLIDVWGVIDVVMSGELIIHFCFGVVFIKKGLQEESVSPLYFDGPKRIRTSDHPVMSRGLYQLSYRPKTINFLQNCAVFCFGLDALAYARPWLQFALYAHE